MKSALCNLRAMIHKAKFNFLNSQIVENREKKSLFRLVDSLLLVKPGLKLPQHQSLIELVERFGQFFVSKIDTIRSALDASDLELKPDLTLPLASFSSFSPVIVPEISSLILSCSSKSSPLDPIPTFLLKHCLHVLAPSITHLINMSLTNGVFPSAMKLAHVTPLLKNHTLDADRLENYRPISLLSFLSKLLERVVARQIVAYLESNSLFVPVQSAYRTYHSTETALLKVMNDLLLAVDRKDATILALLDQSAAFDTVDHTILLNRLSARFGVFGTAHSWFSSYLASRQQSVSVEGVSSTPRLLRFGVPQGSVLGPILYILYNHPLHEIASKFDLKSFTPSPSAGGQLMAYSQLSSLIDEQKEWLTANKLKLNSDKTNILLVSSATTNKLPSFTPLTVNGLPITPSAVVRNLGVLIDSHLTLDSQINSVCKKSFFHLRRIARIRKFLTPGATIQLVKAFVLSQLDYGNSILAGLPSCRLDKLQRVQNATARLIVGSRRSESITPTLQNLHWLPIQQRINYKIAALVFRCLTGTAPIYLADLISVHRPTRPLRSSTQLLLSIPLSKSKNYGDRAFSIVAPTIWNSLPLELRLLPLYPYSNTYSLQIFLSRLKTRLFRVAFV